MTDKINQVLFCYDEKDNNKILGLAVQREHSIERINYTTGWDKIVKELMATYPLDVKGLNADKDQSEIVRRLQMNKRIKVLNKDIIINLTKYSSSIPTENQVVISYVSGKSRALGLTDYKTSAEYDKKVEEYVNEFAKTYGLDADYLEENDFIKTVDVVTKSEMPIPKEEVSDMPVKGGKVKNINKKKILALTMAGCILVGGSFGLGRISKKANQSIPVSPSIPEATMEITPTIEATATPGPTLTPTPNPTNIFRATPTPFPIDYINAEDPALLLRIMLPDVEYVITFEDLMNEPFEIDGVEYSNEYLDFTYLTEISNTEASMISNYLYGNEELPERVHGINFENMFANNPVDKAFIQYFSSLRDEVIFQAYRVGDKEKAKETVKYALYQLLRCYINHEQLELTISGVKAYVGLENLTPQAQNALKEIAYSFYIMQGDSKVDLNHKTFDYQEIGSILFDLPYEEELGDNKSK